MNNNVKAIKAGYALTDEAGNILTSFKYEKIEVYDNFICYTFGGNYGFMDKTGKELTDSIYQNIKVWSDFAIVGRDDKYGIVLKDMTCIIPCECKDIEVISWMGKIYFILTDENYKKCVCYIDEQNNVQYLISDKYDLIYQWGITLICSQDDCIYLRNLPDAKIQKKIKGKLEKRYSHSCSIIPDYYVIESDKGLRTILIYDKERSNLCYKNMVFFGEYDIVNDEEFETSFLEYTRLIVTKRERFYNIHWIRRNEKNNIVFEKIAEDINIVNYNLEYLICGYIMLYDENGVYYLWNLRKNIFGCVCKGKRLKFSYEMGKRNSSFYYQSVKAFMDECEKIKK